MSDDSDWVRLRDAVEDTSVRKSVIEWWVYSGRVESRRTLSPSGCVQVEVRLPQVRTVAMERLSCCQDHECDHCPTCERGRCCRRDNPDYHLPQAGEWDGPLYVPLGRVEQDDGKLVCHACGEAFHQLHAHALMLHNLTAAEYRSIFGLNRRTKLMGPDCREKFSELLGDHLRSVRPEMSPLMLASREQQAAWSAIQNEDRRLEGLEHRAAAMHNPELIERRAEKVRGRPKSLAHRERTSLARLKVPLELALEMVERRKKGELYKDIAAAYDLDVKYVRHLLSPNNLRGKLWLRMASAAPPSS